MRVSNNVDVSVSTQMRVSQEVDKSSEENMFKLLSLEIAFICHTIGKQASAFLYSPPPTNGLLRLK